MSMELNEIRMDIVKLILDIYRQIPIEDLQTLIDRTLDHCDNEVLNLIVRGLELELHDFIMELEDVQLRLEELQESIINKKIYEEEIDRITQISESITNLNLTNLEVILNDIENLTSYNKYICAIWNHNLEKKMIANDQLLLKNGINNSQIAQLFSLKDLKKLKGKEYWVDYIWKWHPEKSEDVLNKFYTPEMMPKIEQDLRKMQAK